MARCLENGLEGISKREMKRIFKMMLPEPSTGRTKLLSPDLQVLMIGLPTDVRLALRHPEKVMGTEKSSLSEERGKGSRGFTWIYMPFAWT